MKIKYLPLIAALFAVTPIVTSCLDNDEVVIDYGSETSITSFKLGTLHIDRIGKDKNGKDSAYVDTINCAKYPFTINQQTRTIENKDSLPMGVHLDKVLTSITADTEIIAYEKNGQDTTWTSTDSINFTVTTDHSLKFRVYTYDLKKGLPYTVKINRHTQDPDSISWKSFDDMLFGKDVIKQKAIFAHNTLFVFGEDAQGKPAYFYNKIVNGQPSGWETTNISSYAKWDAQSATLWSSNDRIFLKATKTNNQSGLIWFNSYKPNQSAGPYAKEVELLIGDGNIKQTTGELAEVLFIKKNGAYGYVKGTEYHTDPTSELSIPNSQPLFVATNTLPYNSSLTQTIVLAYNDRGSEADTCALVFHRLSTDKQWSQYDANQSSGCPNLKDIVMIPYGKKLYAFGGESQKRNQKIKPFETFYVSSDHGRTWQKASEKEYLPTYFAERYDANQHGSFSCCTDNSEGNHFIWIVWKDGKITRGRINHLGFLPKW